MKIFIPYMITDDLNFDSKEPPRGFGEALV